MKPGVAPYLHESEDLGAAMDVEVEGDMGDGSDPHQDIEKPQDSDFFNNFEDDFDDEDLD